MKPNRDTAPKAGTLRLQAGSFRIELLAPGAYEAAFNAKTAVVGYAFDPQSGHHAIGSDRMQPFLRHPNSLAVIPAGCDVRSNSLLGGEYLVIMPGKPDRLDRQATNLCGREALPAAMALRKILLGRVRTEEAEALAGTIVTAATRKRPLPQAARWMTPRRFGRITRMIDERMARTVSVGDLAAAIGVSTSFFSRSFHAFSGTTPQRYVTQRRLYRARHLLVTTDMRLADIAAECGFSSQAHMSRVFSDHTGRPPSQADRFRGPQNQNR
jgi:AraC family transcriptional regulator